MVTGSAGSIGSEISRQLLQFSPRRLVLVDQNETGQFFLDRQLRAIAPAVQIHVCLADVLNEHRVRALLRQYHPQVVFHAAAYKHVPLLESHPEEAVQNIIATTRRLADLAMQYRVGSFVMISTDKAVNPTSVMGTCKRVAELYVQSLTGLSNCRFVTVRFGNVLDSAGSVVQIFRQQIAAGGPVTVTDPRMRRYFMTIPEAARLVIQAGAIGQGGQILLLDMGEPVCIADMAADMIRLSGLRPGQDIAIEFTGLRPGEKLFEELYLPGERRVATSHPKIIVAEHRQTEREKVVKAIDQLELLAREAPEKIFAQLRGIVQEYQQGSGPDVREKRAA
jgi:FlaA1/EpsC-like NDP-sugar epimerase